MRAARLGFVTGRMSSEPRSESKIFPRVLDRALPTAVSAEGVWITDADGRRYLDGAGGAIVVGVGHGDRALIEAAAAQLAKTQYVARHDVHDRGGSRRYADEVARPPADGRRARLPGLGRIGGGRDGDQDGARVPPGRGEDVADHGDRPAELLPRQHARARSTRAGRSRSASPTRRGSAGSCMRPPRTSTGAGTRSIRTAAARGTPAELERMIDGSGRGTVAAFIAEPVGGATLARRRPGGRLLAGGRRGLPPARDPRDRRRGDDGIRPNRPMVRVRPSGVCGPTSSPRARARRAATSRSGSPRATGEVFDTVATGGFVHGFTWSHNALGAAVGLATVRRLRRRTSSQRSADLGAEVLARARRSRSRSVPIVGDVRGLGMMIGIELVRERGSKEPFARPEQLAEEVLAAARDDGLLLYSSTGHVDGTNGDLVMLGPPFVSDRRRGRRSSWSGPSAAIRTRRVSEPRRTLSCPEDAAIYDHGPQHPLRPERVLLTWVLIRALRPRRRSERRRG